MSESHVHCPECLEREGLILKLRGRLEQAWMELRRLDEKLGYENARDRDVRRRNEPL